MLEIEFKFPLTADVSIEQRLRAISDWDNGPDELGEVHQVDRYWAHPSRDFRDTGEALRIRSAGTTHFITYKGMPEGGPARLPGEPKTRHEIELPLGSGDEPLRQWTDLLTRLGFQAVRNVEKVRRRWSVGRSGFLLEVTEDRVEGLGRFAEIEVLASEPERAAATAVVHEVARSLGLSGSQPKSYLRLLLEADRAAAAAGTASH